MKTQIKYLIAFLALCPMVQAGFLSPVSSPGSPYIIGPNSNIIFTYYPDGGMKNGQWVGESIPTAADWSVSKPHLFTLRILGTGNQCIPRSIPSAIDESTNTYATLSCKKASTEIKGVK